MKSVLNINRDNFEREVMESKQPVLLDFYAPWCGPCRMVAPAMEEIANEREDIKVGKVDIEDQKELADRFGVLSVPALVVMKDGKIINRAIGARPKEDILSLVV
ncbi:MAG: thioredoxin [Firmicutes bacterium]|nr:thioredoxin [Bacillota bacterium]MBQ3612217.1 thioredoxin [Bacillota bacterium]MBQ4595651.1 thioredoxin [Bacillota bacterium]MBR1993815.1 thioredoxin [Bacillota bacterium]MBR2620175.1 thioredoxin [Bacillota bacterium]